MFQTAQAHYDAVDVIPLQPHICFRYDFNLASLHCYSTLSIDKYSAPVRYYCDNMPTWFGDTIPGQQTGPYDQSLMHYNCAAVGRQGITTNSMMEASSPCAEEWPPFCCVAAFVAATLESLRCAQTDRSFIAHELNTRVGVSDANPWGLATTDDPDQRGVSTKDAVVLIPHLLQRLSPDLSFRHVRFSVITFGEYLEVLNQSVDQGCVVGIGFNYARLTGKDQVARHVARIAPPIDQHSARLLDDSCAHPPKVLETRWSLLRYAVADIDDGFWIIGQSPSLVFNLV